MSDLQKAPKLEITLYLPDGGRETYVECRLGSSLVPELEFWGKRINRIGWLGSEEHVTSTTLPYTIKNLDHLAPDVVK